MKLAVALASIAGLAITSFAEPPKDGQTKANQEKALNPAQVPGGKQDTSHLATPDKAPSYDDMMKMWADMNKPVAEHKECAKLVGEWDMAVKSVNPMNPAEIHESKGSEKVEWLMEGRYLKAETHGVMGKEPFTGCSISGFNNVTKKFETTWTDSMSTGQMLYVGTRDEKGVLRMTCQYDDPVSGGKRESRMTSEWKDDNTRLMKMYEVEGGNEMLVMEATYTRKNTGTAAKPVDHAPAKPAEKTADKNKTPEK